MTLFDGRRLTQAAIGLDIEGLRRGLYSDKYFENIATVLDSLKREGYRYSGHSARETAIDLRGAGVGDLEVEAQIFNRRAPSALVAGVDPALAMIRYAAGAYAGDQFVEAWRDLEVVALEDGDFTEYGGDPAQVQTVIEVRGRYRDFTLLETPILGVLTRASRIATNVYHVLQAANGKPVLFFPARFDLPQVQSLDGYAYWLAVQRYNHDSGHQLRAAVSTDAQAAWWGGRGGGTVPHALIACFFADTAEAMLAFARHVPVEVPRIVLADFNNDVIRDLLATLDAYWPYYLAALQSGDETEQQRWRLNGVRLDTSANMLDLSLTDAADRGVSPALVRTVRAALDRAWERWDVPSAWQDAARPYSQQVQIVVSGGFNRERIEQFERDGVPVDVYGVGSTFLINDRATSTDFTMDIVRVKIDGRWIDMAKVGRQPGDHPRLRPVDLSVL
jgi:nicotinate phosphoribosyltransferase